MFSEGTKENAAVFVHAATFMIVGLLKSGFGDFAYSTFQKILPNKQKTAYEIMPSLVGSEMCIRDRPPPMGRHAGVDSQSFKIAPRT